MFAEFGALAPAALDALSSFSDLNYLTLVGPVTESMLDSVHGCLKLFSLSICLRQEVLIPPEAVSRSVGHLWCLEGQWVISGVWRVSGSSLMSGGSVGHLWCLEGQ